MIAPSLPSAPESEVGVLGGILLDPQAMGVVVEMLTEDHFYREPNRRLFRAMHGLYRAGEQIDPPVLLDAMRRDGEDHEKAAKLIFGLLDAVPTAANIRSHAKQVRDAAAMRRLIQSAQEIIGEAHSPNGKSADDVVRRAQDRVMRIGSETQRGGLEDVRSLLRPAFDSLEQRVKMGGIIGLRTGFRRLDYLTGGFQRKDLIVLGGRPSMGKTALALAWIRHTAITERGTVALFVLEGGKEAITYRLLAAGAGVNLLSLMNGRLTDDDFVALAHASGHLNSAPLWMDDRAGLTIGDLTARARRFKVERPDLAMIVVDHIHLMAGQGEENRVRELSVISAGLKALAKELDVPVIALAQLSRETEKRKNPRPTLADLRESGSIEQDADLVMFTYRPEYYVLQQHGPEKVRELGIEGQAEIIIAKQRNGPTDVVPAYFDKHTARWYELEDDE